MVLPADRRSGMRQPIKTFEQFRDAISAYRLPRVILAALELKLFTVIGKHTLDDAGSRARDESQRAGTVHSLPEPRHGRVAAEER